MRIEILEALQGSNRLILEAPTGSGKSTQVPQILLDSGHFPEGQVVILQPRRLAARMLASRVAAERGEKLGGTVGYRIRHDNRSGQQTRILYVTEGILLRQIQADPTLKGVSAVIFDEFHERHLYGDISLALALDLQEATRPDLRIIAMSATLDSSILETYLAPCCTLKSQGRTFPVEVDYAGRPGDREQIWDFAAKTLASEFPRTTGHALVFMPGAYEIQRTIQAIRHRVGGAIPVLPLHGELAPEQQDAAVDNRSGRRIIVSTNVAETSLTIDGITLVVDSGLARQARFDAHRGINTLYIEKISLASAAQRAGRAGRTAPGRCIRLWSESDNRSRLPSEIPEVRRLDLSEVVLNLRAVGVSDPSGYRWLERPEQTALDRADSLLRDLGAVADDGSLTQIGRRMLAFPVHPRYARMFVEAAGLGCVEAVATIAALTQSRNLLLRADARTEELREDTWGQSNSDLVRVIKAWRWARNSNFSVDRCRELAIHAETARQIDQISKQFLDIAWREGLPDGTEDPGDEALGRCMLAGFADQVACRRSVGSSTFDLVHGRRGLLANDSVVRNANLIVVGSITDIERGSGESNVILNLAHPIEESWLAETFPGHFSDSSEWVFDAFQKRVVCRTRKAFHDLVLESKDRDAHPSPAAAACLAWEIFEGRLVLKQWDDAVERWITRVNFLSTTCPDLGIPFISAADREILIAEICSDATSYRDVKDRPVRDAVRQWLPYHQQMLVDRLAPDRLELPGGRSAKVTYPHDAPPYVAARIQDLYDVTGSLAICGGRVPLTIHVLAPNHRPVQVTSDLSNFWQTSYPKLKQELQRRYPKHVWR